MPLKNSDDRPVPPALIARLPAEALAEDLGEAGDITSAATIAEDATARGVIRAREGGVLAGMDMAQAVFAAADATLNCTAHKKDGDTLTAGCDIMTIAGSARGLLVGERTALNFLGHLSGIATATAALAARIAHTSARVADTRKTTPNLRALEKAAVRAGGGVNHRFGLHDAMLIKDNHLALAGGIEDALAAARNAAGDGVEIEIEVDTLKQLDAVLASAVSVNAILLDNMPPDTLREAVKRIGGRTISEASGGITAENIAAIAETGIDYISVGGITHSAACLDIGLDIDL